MPIPMRNPLMAGFRLPPAEDETLGPSPTPRSLHPSTTAKSEHRKCRQHRLAEGQRTLGALPAVAHLARLAWQDLREPIGLEHLDELSRLG